MLARLATGRKASRHEFDLGGRVLTPEEETNLLQSTARSFRT